MRVLIRADASLAIGSGHVARCLTLANVLRQYGAQVAFACRQLPGNHLERLQAQGFQTFALPGGYPQEHPQEHPEQGIEALLPWQAEIAELQGVLNRELNSEQPFDWIIVDHYGLDHHWQTAARQWAKQIAVIDDLANRQHAADLLLDQNLTATAQAYGPLIDVRCQTLLGPRFALLREEFRREPIPIKDQPRRVLVNFGGFDAAGETWKAMQAMTGFTELEVDFVAGVDNPAWTRMQTMAASHPNWRLHSYVSDFARLMVEADLFVGAGGGTSWERAAIGLPTICIAVAANQQLNAERLATAGAHVYLGAVSRSILSSCARPLAFCWAIMVCGKVWRSDPGSWSMGWARSAWRSRCPRAPCSCARRRLTMHDCCSMAAMPRRSAVGPCSPGKYAGRAIRPGSRQAWAIHGACC